MASTEPERPLTNASWSSLIDPRHPPEDALLLRYAPILSRLDLGVAVSADDLAGASLGEGAVVRPLTEYGGVEVVLCDESSLMPTGTYKDLDACFITAIVRSAGYREIVVSSGGNLGFALSAYCKRADLGIYFFHPRTTLYKLDHRNFDWPGARLISVDRNERDVKALALSFASHHGLLHVPDIRWRLAASSVRALFLLENTLGKGRRADFIAQTICAGYGPAGIYNCFSELEREGLLVREEVPSFLGFQQEANSPMVRAWRDGRREIRPQHVCPRPDEYIEPGLYNTNPERNYTRLFDLMRYFGGDLASVSKEDYERYLPVVLGWFERRDLRFSRDAAGEIVEKTGLLTGVGIAKAIDQGMAPRGSRIVYLLTGGFRDVERFETPAWDALVDESRSVEGWVAELGARFGLEPVSYRRRADKLFAKPPIA